MTTWISIALSVLIPMVGAFAGFLTVMSKKQNSIVSDVSRLADRVGVIEKDLTEIRAEAVQAAKDTKDFQKEVLEGVSALRVGQARFEEQIKTLFEAVRKL